MKKILKFLDPASVLCVVYVDPASVLCVVYVDPLTLY